MPKTNAESGDGVKDDSHTLASIPSSIRPLLWDVDPDKVDYLGAHKNFVIARLLEYTTVDAWKWLEKTYSKEDILRVNETSRRISDKSRNSWKVWYGVAH